jgi:hypothetical protein
MAHRLVFLTHGQQAPSGSTGVLLSNGGIVWIGDNFPDTVTLGTKLSTDPNFSTTYDSRLATQEEIDEYDYILANPTEPPS